MSTLLSSQSHQLLRHKSGENLQMEHPPMKAHQETTETTVTVMPKSSVLSSDAKTTVIAKLNQMTQCYQADQQVKYLHLQAEIDVLIQKLQTLKQQKQN